MLLGVENTSLSPLYLFSDLLDLNMQLKIILKAQQYYDIIEKMKGYLF